VLWLYGVWIDGRRRGREVSEAEGGSESSTRNGEPENGFNDGIAGTWRPRRSDFGRPLAWVTSVDKYAGNVTGSKKPPKQRGLAKPQYPAIRERTFSSL
jgi:hypothetical protein